MGAFGLASVRGGIVRVSVKSNVTRRGAVSGLSLFCEAEQEEGGHEGNKNNCHYSQFSHAKKFYGRRC